MSSREPPELLVVALLFLELQAQESGFKWEKGFLLPAILQRPWQGPAHTVWAQPGQQWYVQR
jgi:hypothetical protein